mmetsp:Transcript_6441/g.18147  ORF Transcript_6441/g.18147 Transcript_6441/m.18147 type:complete len:135 (+) Transcript_6441:488-892(+)
MPTHEIIAGEFNGDLLSIDNEDTNGIAKSLAGTDRTGVWIGLNDRDVEGELVWSDSDEPPTFTDFWRIRNRDGRDCVHLHSSRQYRWNINRCNLDYRGLYRLPSNSYCDALADIVELECVVESTGQDYSRTCFR